MELNNPTGQLAVQLSSDDYKMLGWAPRYLVKDLLGAIPSYPKLSAVVVRNNVDSAPIAKQVLIELSGVLPVGVEPMSGLDFETLI
ncbi:MAG TPA: hypothetical protein DEQ40_17405 [Oxalobacteraceae bacterium]|nr:hypothetical protein [Oxalobacteraceae bacterium]